MATENCTLLTIENQTLQTCGRTPRRGVGGVWLGVAVGNRVGAATATSLAATSGCPSRGGTGRAAMRSQSSTINSIVDSSPVGTLRRYERNRALSRESRRAASRSSSSLRRKSALIAVNGLQRRISLHWSHLSESPCNACTYVEPCEPSAIVINGVIIGHCNGGVCPAASV